MAAEYYRTNPSRRGLLGHVSFGVASYEISKTFYTAVLKPFGVELVFDDPHRKILGYGIDINHEVVNIFERGSEARAPGPGSHLAFNAPSRQAVMGIWKAGVENGGLSAGKPGVRENYGKDYFAAFVYDPVFRMGAEVACFYPVNNPKMISMLHLQGWIGRRRRRRRRDSMAMESG